ncbi:uncharacterized protein spag16 isoform 2-T2 [Anableps anableps]
MSAKRRDKAEESDGSSEEEESGRAEEEAVASSSSSSDTSKINPDDPTIHNIPESVDDSLRNFLRRLGLTRTLSSFEVEWYGSAQTSGGGVVFIPDALTHRRNLLKELHAVRRDTELLRKEVLEAAHGLLRTQRQKDFHRLQHRRVSEQKQHLVQVCKHLQEHLEDSEVALQQLEEKHEAAMRTKALLSLQRERAQNLPEPKPNQQEPAKTPPPKRWSRPPNTSRPQIPQEAPGKTSFQLTCSIRAHQQPISCIALHPSKPLLASASDDRSWKLWELPRSGEKVRVWDFSAGRCVLVLTGHSQPTWGSSFHAGGHLLASCSADRTARLWDVSRGRCRLILRRHAASVNSVAFLPASDLLLTCSADKTLIVWDARRGMCTATFCGHRHPCNHAAFSPATPAVASCDSRGVVNLWDTRKPASPTATVDAGPQGADQVAFDQSGRLLAVAAGDGSVRLVEVGSCSVSSLEGRRRRVQSVTFDHEGGGSDVCRERGTDRRLVLIAGPGQNRHTERRINFMQHWRSVLMLEAIRGRVSGPEASGDPRLRQDEDEYRPSSSSFSPSFRLPRWPGSSTSSFRRFR